MNADTMAKKSIKKSVMTLVIGMAYCRDIVTQFKNDDSKSNLCECVGEKNKKIETSVARDTFRCMKIEEVYPETRVYTATILRDEIRSSTDEFNINFDVTTRQFISFIKEKNLFFNEIYIDHFRMPAQYCNEKFSQNLMSNFMAMADIGALRSFNEDKCAVIYLPFTAHFFHMIHGNGEHKSYFMTFPLYKSNLNKQNHKLSYVTEEYSHAPEINFSTVMQERYIKCTRKDIMNHSPGIQMQHDNAKKILDEYDRYGGIEDVRFIMLVLSKDHIKKGVSK